MLFLSKTSRFRSAPAMPAAAAKHIQPRPNELSGIPDMNSRFIMLLLFSISRRLPVMAPATANFTVKSDPSVEHGEDYQRQSSRIYEAEHRSCQHDDLVYTEVGDDCTEDAYDDDEQLIAQLSA